MADSESFLVRYPPDVRELIRERARATGQTQNAVIVEATRAGLNVADLSVKKSPSAAMAKPGRSVVSRVSGIQLGPTKPKPGSMLREKNIKRHP